MEMLFDFVQSLHSVEGIRNLIVTGGLIGLIGIIFAETGLLVGFFLPGDSLLISAGVFTVSDGMGGPPLFDTWTLLITLSLAAVIGDQVGFILGRKTGNAILTRPDGLLFKKKHILAAQAFYEKHGGKAIILARFAPFLRTFVPFVAGMADMNYSRFVKFNVFGGIFWVFSMVLLGRFLGGTALADQLHKILIVVIFVSVLPTIIGATRHFMEKKTASAT